MHNEVGQCFLEADSEHELPLGSLFSVNMHLSVERTHRFHSGAGQKVRISALNTTWVEEQAAGRKVIATIFMPKSRLREASTSPLRSESTSFLRTRHGFVSESAI